jgi:hypothetical protein
MIKLLYIDPGGGSMLVQAIIASLLGILYFFKNIKTYIKSFFFKFKKEKKGTE